MDLINALSPYRILLFDSTDGLDSQSHVDMLQFLQSNELRERYDHIFLSVVNYSEVSKELENNSAYTVMHIKDVEKAQLAA